MTTPICPKCREHDFVSSPVPMPNNDYWNPVICKSCGTVVGQLPSNDQREAMERIGKVLTINEDLQRALAILHALEKKVM
jgi:hypothetical protein